MAATVAGPSPRNSIPRASWARIIPISASALSRSRIGHLTLCRKVCEIVSGNASALRTAPNFRTASHPLAVDICKLAPSLCCLCLTAFPPKETKWLARKKRSESAECR